jgi:hypothetical protein
LFDLATTLYISGDQLIETQILARIFRYINQVKSLHRDNTWYTTSDNLVQRYIDIFSDTNNYVILTAFSVTYLATTIRNPRDQIELSSYLYKLAKFEAAYPDFEIPTLQHNLYHRANIVLQVLGRREEAAVFEAKRVKAKLNSPSDPA